MLTPVGLLPLALCGFSVKELLQGAADCQSELTSASTMESNPAMLYAAVRQLLFRQGKQTELLSTFCPRLSTLSEWWKQLFGESEGKEHKGIFPASLVFTTDLHSLGQFVQDGLRMFFETFISVEKLQEDIEIPVLHDNSDELLYLEGKKMSYVNRKAEEATRYAHVQGGVPVLAFEMPELNEYTIGELMYFFEFSCALSAYMFGVNPFDQPGVEAYKSKMFELLGKNSK
ncbi:Glucose-6-phosphate isomerase [bioreactor metagenome]|uniref:glucose-6-phosphate isomerase n=1 Tax=bioreactor metagenome TaxID=1076179 RepID=A0A644X5M1_9ZZZZ